MLRQDKERRFGKLEQELVAAAKRPKIALTMPYHLKKGLLRLHLRRLAGVEESPTYSSTAIPPLEDILEQADWYAPQSSVALPERCEKARYSRPACVCARTLPPVLNAAFIKLLFSIYYNIFCTLHIAFVVCYYLVG